MGKNRFCAYRVLTNPLRVNFGKVGAHAFAIGEGTLTVHGRAGAVSLHRVLHVPELAGNLFSTRVAVDRGAANLFLPAAHPDGGHRVAIVGNAKVIERPGSVTVEGRVVLTASLSEGLYLLDLLPGALVPAAAPAQAPVPALAARPANPVGQSYADAVRNAVSPGSAVRALPDSLPDAVVQEAWLWHRRLGHTGFATLAELCRQGRLPGCRVTPQQFVQVRNSEACEPCVVGKLRRISHPTRNPPAMRALHRIHMDLCYYDRQVLPHLH